MVHYFAKFLRDDKKTRIISEKKATCFEKPQDGRISLDQQKRDIDNYIKYRIRAENRGKNRIIGYNLYKRNGRNIMHVEQIILRRFD